MARNDDLVERRRAAARPERDGHGGRGERDRRVAGAQRHRDRPARERAAPDPGRAQHAALVRQSRPQSAGTRAIAGLLAVIRSLAVLPAARRSSSSPKACRRRPGSRRGSTTSSTSPTAPTSPPTPSTRTACARKARRPTAARSSRRSPTSGCISTPPAPTRTEQPLTMSFERVEDTLRLDSRTGLARLAEDTGGLPRRGVERPVGGVPAHRRRQSVPLPPHLRAEQHEVRRQVPRRSR